MGWIGLEATRYAGRLKGRAIARLGLGYCRTTNDISSGGRLPLLSVWINRGRHRSSTASRSLRIFVSIATLGEAPPSPRIVACHRLYIHLFTGVDHRLDRRLGAWTRSPPGSPTTFQKATPSLAPATSLPRRRKRTLFLASRQHACEPGKKEWRSGLHSTARKLGGGNPNPSRPLHLPLNRRP